VPVSRVKQILEASSESMHENYETSSRALMKGVQEHYEMKLDEASEELKSKEASIAALQLALDEMQVDAEECTYWKDDDAISDYAVDEMDVQLRAPDASMPASSASQGGVMRRNDLCLPTTVYGAIDWERAMPLEIYEEFRRQQDSGKFNCSKCSTDVSSTQGSAGYVQCLRSDGDWEERHLFNVIEDVPESVLCMRCHFASVPCKY
jgi:hypothetical protein